MTTAEILGAASAHLERLGGHVFDLLALTKPVSPNAASNLAKIVSKLSPLVGNLIEFNTVEFLNGQGEFRKAGEWKRQDPGFPDAIFVGPGIAPTPGLEIKAWLPLATEITARFRDSQNHFQEDQTNVCLLAWLPEQVIFGKPRIVDVCVASGLSVAAARDNHYHHPPDYLVLEPEDTAERTRNLRQTNTNGYKWQGMAAQLEHASKLVADWGAESSKYRPTREYQLQMRRLLNRYPYRLDTNFAKIDRIAHPGVEVFKRRVLGTEVHGLTIGQWSGLLSKGPEAVIRQALDERFGIRGEHIAEILE